MRSANRAGTHSKDSPRKKMAVLAGVASCIFALALLCWGCAPQAASSGSSSEETSENVDLGGYPDFTERSSGMFTDNYINTDMLNTGNRGCNSCHADLFEQMVGKEGSTHILTHVGYEKNGTWNDCSMCHLGGAFGMGPYFGDMIHASHYSNDTFLAANGNCWSCHAVNASTENNDDYEFKLWDEFYESGALGGYKVADTDMSVREWVSSRGFKSGLPTEMASDSEPEVDVTLAQDTTDPEDVFIVNNWGSDLIDLEGISSDDQTLSITGVNNPRTFTVDEIRAMPQVDFTAQQSCATNGLGGALSENIPMTGVPLTYIVEQCGGLVDGVNAVNAIGNDGWNAIKGANFELSLMYDDAFVVTKYFGENLTVDQGAPLVLVSRGMPGAQWVKHVGTIEFKETDSYLDAETFANATVPGSKINVNGFWFQNNGNTYKVGEKVELSGACYSWAKLVGELETIRFSFDQGETWTEFDVKSQLPDFDKFQWVNFDLTWTPSAAGKYQIKLDAIDSQGNHITSPVTLFVTVEE